MANRKKSSAPQKSREENRREQRAALEKQRKRKQAITIVLLVAAVVVIAVVLSLTVFFKVSAVEVDAAKSQYTAEQIREASGVSTGDNLFMINKEKVANAVGETLPYTGEITVKRSLPSKVRITVEDSTIAAAVKYNDKYIVLNDKNKVLSKVASLEKLNEEVEKQGKIQSKLGKKTSKSKNTSTTTTTTTTTTTAAVTDLSEESTTQNVKEIRGGEDLSNADDRVTIILGVKVGEAVVGHTLIAKNEKVMDTYTSIMEAMHQYGVTDITLADLSKMSDIKLTYQQRITILLGDATGLDRKAALCAKVLEEQNKISTEQKGNIDLSIAGKAYFSEGGATTRTTTTTTTTLPTEPVTDLSSTDASTEVSGVTDVAGVTGTTDVTDPGSTTTSTTENDLINTGG